MAVTHKTPTLPWDREPEESGGAMLAYGCATVPLLLLVCAFGIVTCVSLIALIGGMIQDARSGDPSPVWVIGTMGLPLVGVWVALLLLLLLVRRGWHTSRAAVEHHGAGILFVQRGFTCFLHGHGDVSFGEDSMAMTGTLRSDLFGPFFVAYFSFLFCMKQILMPFGVPPYLVSLTLLPILLTALLFVFRRISKLEQVGNAYVGLGITPTDIKSVQCTGPLVTIKFKRPPVGRLRGVRFYVAPHFRDYFYTEFERVFPGLLPKQYRAAVADARRAQGRDVP